MSGKKRRKKEKSRKKLAYGVIAVAFILICFLVYFSFHQSNPTSQPKAAAIVDQLSFFPDQRNPAFISACENILKSGGLTWAYYKDDDITVDFYRNLPSYGTRLIILRVHSAIMRVEGTVNPILGLFTSERYSDEAARKYRDDVLNDRLVKAFFTEGGDEYFGIVPKFIEESMKGKFNNTIIIMMGCEGLGYNDTRTGERITYTDMAEAFINKGAKVYIGWNGWVSLNHTDQETLDLLESLIRKEQTIKEAVEKADADPHYKSVLKFYPEKVGTHTISVFGGSLTTNVAEINIIYVKSWRFRIKPFHKFTSN